MRKTLSTKTNDQPTKTPYRLKMLQIVLTSPRAIPVTCPKSHSSDVAELRHEPAWSGQRSPRPVLWPSFTAVLLTLSPPCSITASPLSFPVPEWQFPTPRPGQSAGILHVGRQRGRAGSWALWVKVGLRSWVESRRDSSAWRRGSTAEWRSVSDRPLARSKAGTCRSRGCHLFRFQVSPACLT